MIIPLLPRKLHKVNGMRRMPTTNDYSMARIRATWGARRGSGWS